MSYQFSNPVQVGGLSPKLGAPLSDWPSRMTPLKYKYSGLGQHLGPRYKFTGFGTVPATTEPVQVSTDMLSRFGVSSSVMSTLNTVAGIVGALAGIAQLIISQIHDIDPNTRSVATKIITWIRQIVAGQPLSAVTFSPGEVNSMLDYCTNVRPIVEGAVGSAIGIASGLALAAHNSGAVSALNTVQTILIGGPTGGGGIANFVCTIPQVQTAMAAAAAAASAPTMQTCTDGSVIPADQTCPAPSRLRYLPGLILPQPMILNLQERCADGSTAPWGHCPAAGDGGGGGGGGGGEQPQGMSTGMMVGIAVALGLGIYAYSKS